MIVIGLVNQQKSTKILETGSDHNRLQLKKIIKWAKLPQTSLPFQYFNLKLKKLSKVDTVVCN